MARAPKIGDIPVFTKEDTRGIHRLFAFLSYWFPLGTLIMWIIFHKKSKFIRMHVKNAFKNYITFVVGIPLCFGLVIGGSALVMYLMGKVEEMLAIITVVGIIFGIIYGIVGIVFAITMLVSVIRALCGKLVSNKKVRACLREQLALRNPEAIEIIKTDARFADILAEYNAVNSADKAE